MAYGPYSFQQPMATKDSAVWNIATTHHPELTLRCDSSAVSVDFHYRDHALICAGYINGTVACYDIRKGGTSTVTSELHVSHKDYVTRALWINSKSNSEFFSAGEDGCVMWWDMRNMAQPAETFYCDPMKRNSPESALVISCLEFESTVPIKYMVGTYCGNIFQYSRKARTPAEAHQFCMQGGAAPVYCIERNKANNKVFLSVGDWGPRIWHEELRDSYIMEMCMGEINLTGGCWSPTKMNSFFTIDESGHLNCYDFILDHKWPVLKFKVSEETLACIKVTANGQRAYVGDTHGVVREMILPPGFYAEKKIERAAFHHMIERELKREKLVDSKKREAKLEKKRTDESGSGGAKSRSSISKQDVSRLSDLKQRNPKCEEITLFYQNELKKSEGARHKMYAEMFHHGKTLFQFDEKGMNEISKNMELSEHHGSSYMQNLIDQVAAEEKLKASRRRSSSVSSRVKPPRRISHAIGEMVEGVPPHGLREPAIEEQTEASFQKTLSSGSGRANEEGSEQATHREVGKTSDAISQGAP